MQLKPWRSVRLEELVALWNKELEERFPMRKELLLQNSFLDENISYGGSRIVVNEKDRVIGFVIVKYVKEETPVKMRDDIGWIQALLVDSAYRKQGIGTLLLRHAEEVLKEKGMKGITLGRDTYHYFPGVPSEDKETARWFEKRDYQHYVTDYDMKCTYLASEKLAWPAMQNVEFLLLQEGEKDALLDFMHRCFPGRWEYEAMHYFKKGGTGREFVVVKENGKIIGFCRINDALSPIMMGNVNWAPLFDVDTVGGIGPLGVAASRRKNGYGLAVVRAAVAALRERGVTDIIIDWTGIIDFYKKLGYDIWKSYKAYKKEIG
ncbi:GNAT family N-acetyltransferase [Ornithinibacillus contaminans]|uniref:GNAT family N-acetyltransferase n=1 Tax=Ornithinibacillus contaminans TaxID=694055 RepID=UPI00064D99F5|nr:GNAT family N-acetyltransferase [Ornithinibacillus contaminans]